MVERNKEAYIPELTDVIWLDFAPQKGHEQDKMRPALVLSPKTYNEKSGLCLCVPITSKIKGYPFEVQCKILGKNRAILSDQIKSVDYKARKARFITKCDIEVFDETKLKIALLLDMDK